MRTSFGTGGCNANHINAGAQLLPEAGAERTLEAVRCSAVILIEASPLRLPPWDCWQWERQVAKAGGALRRVDTNPQPFDGGLD